MINTMWAIVREGNIDFLEDVELPEGATVLVTVLSDEDTRFWQAASQTALDAVWNNEEDDVYAELLKQ